MGERAMRLEARCHPDRVGVDAAGMWGEGHASYPGRTVRLSICLGLVASRDATKGGQESAEAIVAARTAVKGRTRGAFSARSVRCAKETQ
jgi:hypothetical protein